MTRIRSFDTETALIRPGVTLPEMACLTWQSWSDRNPIIEPAQLLWHKHAAERLHTWLKDPETVLTGANTAFDMGVTCANFPELTDLVWEAYEAERVTDVQIREKLLDIASGRFQGYVSNGVWSKPKYSLADVSRKYGLYLDKPNRVVGSDGKMVDDPLHVRLRYQELRNTHPNTWDEYARTHGFTGPPPTVYAKEDAEATLTCHLAQEPYASHLKLQWAFSARDWCLKLASAWGTRTEAKRVAQLIERAEAAREEIKEFLIEHGLVRPNGTRDLAKARAMMIQVCANLNMEVPQTETGLPQLGEDACNATEDPILEQYAKYGKLGKTISADGAALSKGTIYPIHTRYDMAATGRTTSSKPNMANWSRQVGPRECFVPRDGMVFVQADYKSLELCTLAQVCLKLFGKSRLAEALNRGLDVHALMAADMLGITYEEIKRRLKLPQEHPLYKEAYETRQCGKVANFGFPGGLGAEKLVLWGRKTYGVILTVERARELKVQWMRSWPEMRDYLEYINRLCNGGNATLEVPISGFRRGDAPYCAAANTFFQSLGASAAGRGIWYLSRACYYDRSSVLFGSRLVNHIHDENIGEVKDDDTAHDKAMEWERLMVKGAKEFIPDVLVEAPPLLMAWWSKDAFAVKNDNGQLEVWRGQQQEEA